MKGLVVRSSYTMDLLNFLAVLTGQEFYVREHRDAFDAWRPRLSHGASQALAEALAVLGSPYLGARLCLPISAVPDFDAAGLPALLAGPERVRDCYQHCGYYDAAVFPTWFPRVCALVLPVVRELEALGFRAYWEAERLPAILAAVEAFRRAVAPLDFDLAGAVAAMLGPGHGPAAPVTLILCSFVAPHGVKVCGPVYLADMRYPHPNTLRQALHEMFHPPYREEEVADELAALAADPLVRASFAAQDPVYRYASEHGWIEENVVEAMAHVFARDAGFADDPLSRAHLDGNSPLSAVLLEHMRRLPKDATEPFAAYFRRLVRGMPVGRLDRAYATLHDRAPDHT